MDFSIVLDTAGSKVGELGSELRKILVDEINNKYKNDNVSIGVAIRCLPKSYNRKSFVRFNNAENYLTIDFCVPLEEYEKKYKIEQKFDLGNDFLFWLDKGFTNKKFLEKNPDFDIESFKKSIIEIGRRNGWFVDEIDWTLELDS